MKVPTYEQQVQARPLPGVKFNAQADPNAFGAGVAKAVGGFGASVDQASNDLYQRSQVMQQEVNANIVLDNSNKWQTEVNNYLYNEKDGVFTLKGSQTSGLTEAAAKKIQEINAKYETTLQNENQRTAFKKFVSTRAVSTVEGISRYQANEHQEWRKQTKEGTVANSLANIGQIAASGISDPNMIYAQIDTGLKAIDAQNVGQAPEFNLAEKRKFVSDSNTAVVNNFLAKQDYRGARAWFEKNKGSMLDAANVEAALGKGEEVAEFQGLSKSLLAKYGIEGEAAALAEVDSMLPAGPKREKARDYLRGEIANARRQDNQGEADRYNKALLQIRGAKTFDEMQTILNASGLQKAEHLTSLENVAKAKLGIDLETGRPKVTSIGVYTQALTEFEGGQIPDMNHFLMKYGKYMSDPDLKKFSEKILNGETGVGWVSLIKDIAPKVKEKDLPNVLDTVEQMERQYKVDNGIAPNTGQRAKMVNDAVAEIILADGKMGKRYEADMPVGTYWDADKKMFVVESNGQLFQVKPKKRE